MVTIFTNYLMVTTFNINLMLTTFTNNLTVKAQHFVVFFWFSVLKGIFSPYITNPCIDVMETQCVFYGVWNQILNKQKHLLLWNTDSHFFDLFHSHSLSFRSFILQIHFYPTFGLYFLLYSTSFLFFMFLIYLIRYFGLITGFWISSQISNVSETQLVSFDGYLLVACSFPFPSAKFIAAFSHKAPSLSWTPIWTAAIDVWISKNNY